MLVSIRFLKRVRCAGSISAIKPTSIEEKVRAVEAVVVLALTIDIAFTSGCKQSPPARPRYAA
jgi:hypothetical protein